MALLINRTLTELTEKLMRKKKAVGTKSQPPFFIKILIGAPIILL
jgi:hypothetical protein